MKKRVKVTIEFVLEPKASDVEEPELLSRVDKVERDLCAEIKQKIPEQTEFNLLGTIKIREKIVR